MYALGLDIGTTTLSAVVVDARDGRVLQSLTVPNDAGIAADPWARLQDPERIWEKALGILHELMHAHPGIRCIGLTGQMHGILYADAQGRALSPLIGWQDGRGELTGRDGRSYARALSERTGYRLATGYGVVSHAYNQTHGLVPARAVCLMTIQDYIGMCLTGRAAPLIHTSDAASLGAFDLRRGSFDFAALERAGIGAALFPEVSGATALLGETAVDELPRGIPVSLAIGDNQASFIGSVKRPEASVLVNMGTGGQVSVAVDSDCGADGCELRPYLDGGFLLVGFSLCGGRAYALLERLMREIAVRAGAPDRPLYELMNALAEEGSASSDALEVCTQFAGTRAQPERRGCIQRIGTDNFTAANLVQGVIHGMVDELHGPYLRMRSQMKRTPEALVGSGNGIRRNPALRRAFSDAFGLELTTPKGTEEAAYGASLFSLAASGIHPSVSAAQAIIQYE